MTTKELAAKLDGREYRKELTVPESEEARRNGLVVVFGYSDDNMEFRGAIDDEVGCYDGGSALVTREGTLEACNSVCKYYRAAEKLAKRSRRSGVGADTVGCSLHRA